jgi:cell division protein ZipA
MLQIFLAIVAIVSVIRLVVRFRDPVDSYDGRAGRQGSGRQPMGEEGDIYFVPANFSAQRLIDLGMDRPTADFSHILDRSTLNCPTVDMDAENAEFRANPILEWVLSIAPVEGELFTSDWLSKTFDQDLRTKAGQFIIYGRGADDGRWTYGFSGDAPEAFTSIEVGIALQDMFAENPQPALRLHRAYDELEKHLREVAPALQLVPDVSLTEAVQKANVMLENRQFDQDVIVVLKGDRVYNGLDVWNVLLSVGLKWGDGDLFHWADYDNDYGDDTHFSVWTDTNPGYFLPEDVKAGRMHPKELVFGYSIPRSADPEGVFNVMADAIAYCQNKLGGELYLPNDQGWDQETEWFRLLRVVKEMKESGIVPGSDVALRQF